MVSPSGKVYIGITDDVNRRESEHRRSVGKNGKKYTNLKIVNAIRKYGFDAMNFEMVCIVFNDYQAKRVEQLLIIKHDSYTNGYNLTWGGDSRSSHGKLSPEELEEIRNLLEFEDISIEEIGKRYDVHGSSILDIQNNRRWKYMGNARTIIRKNRSTDWMVGSNNGISKLTEDLVFDMRTDSMNGDSRRDLQNKYNVSKTLVQQILTLEIWTHVKVPNYEIKKVRNGNAKLTEDEVRSMWLDRIGGMSQKLIWKKYGVSRSTVQAVLCGNVWRDIYDEFNE